MWRIGMLAGTGTGRKRILPALRGSDLCRVTVVQGRDPDRLAEVRRTDAGVRLTTSRREFAGLSQLYDVVYIGSPPFRHPDDVAFATGLGKPVICEKPLATNHHQVQAIARTVQAAGVPFTVAHQLRHQQATVDIERIVRDGTLGPVCGSHLQWAFQMDVTAPNAAWKLNPDLAGSSSMFDSGVHAVDLAILLFGTPRAVNAFGHRRRSGDVVDSVTAMLDYGTFGVTVAASTTASTHANDLVVTCSDGVLYAPSMLGENSTPTLHIRRRDDAERRDYASTNLYQAEVENFCRLLAGGPAVGTTLADAVAASNVLFAIEEAVASGCPVAVDWVWDR